MVEQLETCPFCGGKAKFIQSAYGTTERESARLSFKIVCEDCGASYPYACGYIAMNLSSDGNINIWHDERESAIAAWNRRANK